MLQGESIMHKYLTLRGSPRLLRRVIEEIQDIYYPLINKDTKKTIGLIQVIPREIRTFEVVFPETSKKDLKKDIQKVITNICSGRQGGICPHWGPWKNDKYKDGVELL